MAVGCADGDGVSRGEFGDGRQLVAGFEAPALDLVADGWGDHWVCAARRVHGDGGGHDRWLTGSPTGTGIVP